jgi:tetratricopeptide (TPR) repeat protein
MATEWKIGDRLESRWEIHKIMRGGMGVVYVVHDHEWNEVLAAKTFQDAVFARNPTIAPMFTREALAWVQLDAHPNIANALFVQEIEGKPVLFLEYVSGGDLSGWIGTPRLMDDLPQMLRFAVAFCDGMIHARSRGIEVHRDIKPQNCLITSDGTLKVTDFGLAKVFDDAGAGKSGIGGTAKPGVFGRLFGRGPASNALEAGNPNVLAFSRTGNAAGTCTHMPPEQFVDSKHVGVQADIYSFGVTLYQMLSGHLPFMGRSWEEFERLHRTQAAPPLDVKHPPLRGVVEKCLAKQPAARWRDFEQLREPLAAAYKQLTGSEAPRAVVGAELDAAQWLNKGVSLKALGLDDQALACYKRALEINPRDAKAWSNKGGLVRDLGRMEEALACFDQAAAIDPQADLAWYNKGSTFEILGKPQEALVCLDQALALNPLNHMAWSSKGVALDKLGRYEEAIVSFDRALQIHPRFVAALANKGNQLRNLGRLQEALACHERAIEIDSSLRALWANKANVLSDMKRYQEALAAFDQALVLSPDFTVCLYGKGVVYVAMGQPGEALACCECALRINPGEAYGWVYKAEALEKLGRPEEALAAYDQAIEINKYDASAWLKKGSLLKGLGRTDESFACCTVVMISIKPRDALTWHNTGVQLRELGKPNEALLCHERAVEINPRLDEAWLGKVNMLVDLGRFEEAMAAHDQGLAANPGSASLWYSKGATLGNADRFREALACFEKAYELGEAKAAKAIATCREALGESAPPAQPQQAADSNLTAEQWHNKGADLTEQGNPAEGLICFEKALAISPRSAESWYGKAVALGKMRRFEEELACYDQVLAIAPSFAGAWFSKGRTLGGVLQRYREALVCFEKAQQLGHPHAAKGIEICQKGLAEEAASTPPNQVAASAPPVQTKGGSDNES